MNGLVRTMLLDDLPERTREFENIFVMTRQPEEVGVMFPDLGEVIARRLVTQAQKVVPEILAVTVA
jgi:hypothetical protein